jgi:hypothetical protein
VSRRQTLILILLITGTVWLARFWHFADFGFYEDDYWRVTSSMHLPFQDLVNYLARLFTEYGDTQGRPFHDGFIRIFSFAGAELGGKNGVYFLAFCCVALNAVLFALLLKRISSHVALVWMGGFAFALFPLDTTQTFLTHSFGIQPSLTFLLVSALLYVSGRRTASYVVATGSLFCYETVFLVALVFPLLDSRWGAAFRRQMLRHGAIILAIMAGALLLRSVAGVERVSEFTAYELAATVAENSLAGPVYSATSYLWRTWETLEGPRGITPWHVVLAAVGFFLLLCWLPHPISFASLRAGSERPRKKKEKISEAEISKAKIEDRSFLLEMRWWAITGIVALVLAYPATFTTSAHHLYGRGTRAHSAAVFGAALLAAAVCTVLFHYAARYRAAIPAMLLLSVISGSLVAWGFSVQFRYADGWRQQKEIWTRLILQTPDLGEGDSILMPPKGRMGNREVPVFSWSTPEVLPQVYQIPGEWELPPQIFALEVVWDRKLAERGSLWNVCDPPISNEARRSRNPILFTGSGTDINRETNPFIVDGQRYPVKDATTPRESPMKKGTLYQYLIEE